MYPVFFFLPRCHVVTAWCIQWLPRNAIVVNGVFVSVESNVKIYVRHRICWQIKTVCLLWCCLWKGRRL